MSLFCQVIRRTVEREDEGEEGEEEEGDEGEEVEEEKEGRRGRRRKQAIERTGDWGTSLSFPGQAGTNYPPVGGQITKN